MDEVAFDFGREGECSDVAAANELELLRRLRLDLDILKGGLRSCLCLCEVFVFALLNGRRLLRRREDGRRRWSSMRRSPFYDVRGI